MQTKNEITGYKLTDKLRKVRRRFPLTATEQALFYELIAICNEDSWAEVFACSNAEICGSLRISENTLLSSRNSLIESGLLFYRSGKSKREFGSYSFSKNIGTEVTKISRSTSKFAVDPAVDPAVKHCPTTSNFEVNAAVDTGVNAAVDTGVNAADYKQTKTKLETKVKQTNTESAKAQGVFSLQNDPEKPKATTAKKTEKLTVVFPWESEKFMKAWQTWKDYKKAEHRFSFKSPHSEQLQLSDLAKISGGIEQNAELIINQSITKGWKGLFALDPKTKIYNHAGNLETPKQPGQILNSSFKQKLADAMAGSSDKV